MLYKHVVDTISTEDFFNFEPCTWSYSSLKTAEPHFTGEDLLQQIKHAAKMKNM